MVIFLKGLFMNYNDLRSYAISGIMFRISKEKERLQTITDEKHRKQIEHSIEKMIKDYNEIIKESGIYTEE